MTASDGTSYRMYMAGKWVESSETMEVCSPVTGEVIGTLHIGDRGHARRAVEAARRGHEALARLSVWERSRLCLRIAEAIEQDMDRLARVLTMEQGKPFYREARGEVQRTAQHFRNAAELIKWLETGVMPAEDPHKRVFTIRQPRGVYGIVTPNNAPMSIPAGFLAPGLVAGNGIVWVPAPSTSACAVSLMECLEKAGLPAGAVNLVLGPGAEVGDEVVAHPGVDAVAFTGSSQTGIQIARRAAGKPLLLEMGGNGPTILLEDADLGRAVPAVAAGCFINAGQVCSSTERLLVHRSIHRRVIDALLEQVEQVVVGDPFHPETTMGPLHNEVTVQKVEHHIADAVAKGARLLYGGRRLTGFPTNLYFQPTLLDQVPTHTEIWREETFGPVIPVTVFDTEEEALALANDNAYGLIASVFTERLDTAFRFAEKLRSGVVNVNERSNYWEIHVPAGGASGKRSGIGRIGGKHVLLEMTDLKTIAVSLRPEN